MTTPINMVNNKMSAFTAKLAHSIVSFKDLHLITTHSLSKIFFASLCSTSITGNKALRWRFFTAERAESLSSAFQRCMVTSKIVFFALLGLMFMAALACANARAGWIFVAPVANTLSLSKLPVAKCPRFSHIKMALALCSAWFCRIITITALLRHSISPVCGYAKPMYSASIA